MPKIPGRGKTIYIGIDPGSKGGLTWIDDKGKVCCVPMPRTEEGVWDWFLTIPQGNRRAVIEKVWAAPTQGRKQGGSSMFKFGAAYGFLRACLIASEIPFVDRVPVTWLKVYDITKEKGEKPRAWKNRLRDLAHSLFPKINVKLEEADSLLIAEYCRRGGFDAQTKRPRTKTTKRNRRRRRTVRNS